MFRCCQTGHLGFSPWQMLFPQPLTAPIPSVVFLLWYAGSVGTGRVGPGRVDSEAIEMAIYITAIAVDYRSWTVLVQ